MFRVENNVPEVYIKYSRDFQLLARLYDLVLQSTRFSIDSMQLVSDTQRCNERMLPLIATKVGFFHELDISANVHRAVLSAFPVIIKHKGSMKAIELLCALFERIDDTRVRVAYETSNKNFLTIIFDTYYSNLDVFKELVEYVRPTGMIVEYVAAEVISATGSDVNVDVSSEIHSRICSCKASRVHSYDVTFASESSDGGTIGFTEIANSVIDCESNNAQEGETHV